MKQLLLSDSMMGSLFDIQEAVVELFINIDVDDLEKAVAFYRNGLDLREARRLFDGSVVEMSGASSTIHLLAKDAGSLASRQANIFRSYRRHWTPVHLDFVVEDIAAASERCGWERLWKAKFKLSTGAASQI